MTERGAFSFHFCNIVKLRKFFQVKNEFSLEITSNRHRVDANTLMKMHIGYDVTKACGNSFPSASCFKWYFILEKKLALIFCANINSFVHFHFVATLGITFLRNVTFSSRRMECYQLFTKEMLY